MKFSMTLHGASDLAKRLDALPLRKERQVVLSALKAGAEPIKKLAEQQAPREPGKPDLADHIGVRSVPQRQGEEPTVAVGLPRDFFYDWFLEYGTAKHSADPFWRPAFDVGAPAGLDIISRELWTAVRKAAGQGSVRATGASGGGLL